MLHELASGGTPAAALRGNGYVNAEMGQEKGEERKKKRDVILQPVSI